MWMMSKKKILSQCLKTLLTFLNSMFCLTKAPKQPNHKRLWKPAHIHIETDGTSDYFSVSNKTKLILALSFLYQVITCISCLSQTIWVQEITGPVKAVRSHRDKTIKNTWHLLKEHRLQNRRQLWAALCQTVSRCPLHSTHSFATKAKGPASNLPQPGQQALNEI